MTIAELRSEAAYYQKRLNIPEWTITVRWMRNGERPNDDGTCTWHIEDLQATILIRRNSKEQLVTLVHELLHIVLDGHPHGTYCEEQYSRFHEQSINRIARALVNERAEKRAEKKAA